MKIHFFLFTIFLLLLFKIAPAQIAGCPDPLANNFNPSATQNDGSCTYDEASVAPTTSFNLAADFTETSGLISWNSEIWTHNDNNDRNIYGLDSSNGNLIQSYLLNGVTNIDWEEISQDDEYVYIGDFGNNSNGNRTDLKILRIGKNSILAGNPIIETINYSYSNQTDFTPAGPNKTDFDCEAFIVSTDSIFLFTKQWISNKTSVYSLSKTPGTFVAKLKSTLDVQGLITGATYIESKNLIALSGYTNLLQPFVYLIYDFDGNIFFSGNKRKIQVSLPYSQVEGITTSNGLKYVISNEKFVQAPFINSPQMLHKLDMSSFLQGYLNNLVYLPEAQPDSYNMLFPNPANDFINIKTKNYRLPATYRIMNVSGQIVMTGEMTQKELRLNISGLYAGLYIVMIENENLQTLKLMKN